MEVTITANMEEGFRNEQQARKMAQSEIMSGSTVGSDVSTAVGNGPSGTYARPPTAICIRLHAFLMPRKMEKKGWVTDYKQCSCEGFTETEVSNFIKDLHQMVPGQFKSMWLGSNQDWTRNMADENHRHYVFQKWSQLASDSRVAGHHQKQRWFMILVMNSNGFSILLWSSSSWTLSVSLSWKGTYSRAVLCFSCMKSSNRSPRSVWLLLSSELSSSLKKWTLISWERDVFLPFCISSSRPDLSRIGFGWVAWKIFGCRATVEQLHLLVVEQLSNPILLSIRASVRSLAEVEVTWKLCRKWLIQFPS